MKQRIGLVLLFSVTLGISSVLAQRLMIRVGYGVPVQAQAGLYSGGILFVNAGTCPALTTEVAGLAGKTLFGTVAGNGDVGDTGGADSITATTASVTQPTIAWPAGVPTSGAVSMSGALANESTHTHSVTSNVTVADHASHTHTYTEVINHVHLQSVGTAATGGLAGYTYDASTNTSVAAGYSTANPTGSVGATGTTAGPGAALTHTPTNNAVTSGAGAAHTHGLGTLAASTPVLSWPAGVPTATGSALTMNSFDNRSAFTKVIACKID